MQYTFETLYNQESLAVMAKCLRKTIRKKKSKRSHIFGWLVVALAVLLSFVSGDEGFVIDLRTILTWIAGAAIVIALVFEDQINGYFARKRMLKGTEKAVSVFDTEDPSGFVSETEIGRSEFSYERIAMIAETGKYYVFVFSENHAQIYDKSKLSGGTTEEFEHFLCNMTKKTIVKVSWFQLGLEHFESKISASIIRSNPVKQKNGSTVYENIINELEVNSDASAAQELYDVMSKINAVKRWRLPFEKAMVYTTGYDSLSITFLVDGKRVDLSMLSDSHTIYDLGIRSRQFHVNPDSFEKLAAVVEKYGVRLDD